MSAKETRALKHKGSHDALESLDRPYTLGTDADGAVHHHSPYDDRVVVVDERGGIEHSFDLTDRDLSAYIAHVDDCRGWATLNYADSFGEILVEGLQ